MPQYLLVRPYPSLRITFTSSALRIPGLLQSKLLDRIGGPQHVREGILEAFAAGVGVTAKIHWVTAATVPMQPGSPKPSGDSGRGSIRGDRPQNVEGKPRWIHCTPLLGSDEKVGVWMVVMVESEVVTGGINVMESREAMTGSQRYQPSQGVRSPKYAGGDRLYAEYLRREGGPPGAWRAA